MKKGLKIALASLGLALIGGVGILAPRMSKEAIVVRAEEETIGYVVIDKPTHGKIETSIESGNVGDICVITATHDLLYKIDYVSVNGVNLVEDTEIDGKFSFALVAGINTITANFVVDEELCGAFTNMVEQAENKDWAHFFSTENILTIIKWLLDGGVLIALIRYYVKDKKLESKLESKVEESINKVIPTATKETVLKTVENVMNPIFSQLQADNVELMKAMSVFSKCMALAQENTPESRRAILDELSGLKIGDLNTIESVKKYIEELVAEHDKAFKDALAALDEIKQANQEIVEEKPSIEEEKVDSTDDGTSI